MKEKRSSDSADVKYYSIGDLAREFDVTLRALRFYESKGLLKPKREGEQRLFTVEDCERLKRILKGKQLGFTLSEIGALLNSDGKPSKGIGLHLGREQLIEQISLLERRKMETEDAIAELRQLYPGL
jgi:DNA-binding transcriptional MerR regulator